MRQYLLDTNICVYLFRDKFDIARRIDEVSPSNCFLSDITVAELKYGAYKSLRTEENLQLIDEMLLKVAIIPFADGIDIYAREKNRLRSQGTPIEDFDLLIASAAMAHGLTLVTDNTKHFKNIFNLEVENWVER